MEWCAFRGFHLHNTPGVGTFFRKDYESVLDLLWSSSQMTAHISNYRVRHDLHMGSDHYPSTFEVSYSPEPPIEPSFSFRDDNRDPWQESFSTHLETTWTFHDYLPDAATFVWATNILMDAMITASKDTCQCKERTSRANKWFNGDVKDALRLMRNSRVRCKAVPSCHNLLSHKVSYQKFKYEVRKAKRSFTLGIASSVKANTNLWKLNSWYRGVRKTLTPSLKHPNGGWATGGCEKVDLLTRAWFPPPASLDPTKFVIRWDSPHMETRPFHPVTYEEVERALKGTSGTSAPGISGIGYKPLKWAFLSKPDEFMAVIRASVRFGSHHPRWKSSLVVAIPKPNKPDYSNPKAHRPIQLIECLGKLVEKIVVKHLLYDAGRYDLMPHNQFGGRSNASCLNAALSLQHDIFEARRKGLVSSFLAMDIRGFFDHVNHDRMIHILWKKGFPCHELKSCSPRFAPYALRFAT